ncbi:hypothetical protein ACP4OV_012985 [Aristida adscensionis]
MELHYLRPQRHVRQLAPPMRRRPSRRSCPPLGVCASTSSLHHFGPTPPLSALAPTVTPPPPHCTPLLLVSFLAAVRVLSPKVVVVMEQGASHNGSEFTERSGTPLCRAVRCRGPGGGGGERRQHGPPGAGGAGTGEVGPASRGGEGAAEQGASGHTPSPSATFASLTASSSAPRGTAASSVSGGCMRRWAQGNGLG